MRVKTQKNYFQTCGYTVAAGSKAHKVLQVPMAIGTTKIIKSIKTFAPMGYLISGLHSHSFSLYDHKLKALCFLNL